MSTLLRIGKGKHGFTLPLDLVTSTQAILARKRSGKSYTASVQAEEMLDQNQQVVVSYADLAGDVAMEVRSGTFSDYLSLLRTTGLITTEGGTARANAEVLFL